MEFFGPKLEPVTFIIPEELYDEKGEVIDVANHPRMIVKFKVDIPLSEFDMMRTKVFDISQFM